MMVSYDYETYRVNTALVGNKLCTLNLKKSSVVIV